MGELSKDEGLAPFSKRWAYFALFCDERKRSPPFMIYVDHRDRELERERERDREKERDRER